MDLDDQDCDGDGDSWIAYKEGPSPPKVHLGLHGELSQDTMMSKSPPLPSGPSRKRRRRSLCEETKDNHVQEREGEFDSTTPFGALQLMLDEESNKSSKDEEDEAIPNENDVPVPSITIPVDNGINNENNEVLPPPPPVEAPKQQLPGRTLSDRMKARSRRLSMRSSRSLSPHKTNMTKNSSASRRSLIGTRPAAWSTETSVSSSKKQISQGTGHRLAGNTSAVWAATRSSAVTPPRRRSHRPRSPLPPPPLPTPTPQTCSSFAPSWLPTPARRISESADPLLEDAAKEEDFMAVVSTDDRLPSSSKRGRQRSKHGALTNGRWTNRLKAVRDEGARQILRLHSSSSVLELSDPRRTARSIVDVVLDSPFRTSKCAAGGEPPSSDLVVAWGSIMRHVQKRYDSAQQCMVEEDLLEHDDGQSRRAWVYFSASSVRSQSRGSSIRLYNPLVFLRRGTDSAKTIVCIIATQLWEPCPMASDSTSPTETVVASPL